MDARRLLVATCGALALTGCATLDKVLPGKDGPAKSAQATTPAQPVVTAKATPDLPTVGGMAPIPNPPQPADAAPPPLPVLLADAPSLPPGPPEPVGSAGRRGKAERRTLEHATGRAAIAEANAQARAASRADAFEGGVQVFGYEPGRLYEIWAAPYRVTTLTLAPGETVTSKAAGDTVRWQIGEATSGTGAEQRAHVILKPLQAGLETNLVVTTSQRVYMLMLRSGAGEAFNAAVAWRYAEAPPIVLTPEPAAALVRSGLDIDRVDARYRIEPRGRSPRWTPTSVFNDGARTFIAFAPDLQVDEAPVLFVLAPDGEAQVVNYRQQGGMFVVDRLFDRAELRLGAKRPQVVRISRAPDRRAGR